jgi:ABC-2 type transport system ATP-binding protein
MPSQSAIEVSNLTKYYGKLLAVDHINFEVKSKELFGFLGPNGAGKTTTINMITGVTKPTSGAAFILGHDVTQEPVKAKEHVGVVPDVSGVYDEMTAWDNITFSAKLHGVPKEKRATCARELLELFGLYDRRNDRASTFSRGMKRRLMTTTALVHEPEILFMDEPTTGLDVQSSRQIRSLIKELNKKGTTVFLTTHYIEEADQLCQRIAIIDRGKIITVDNPEKLKTMVQVEYVIEVSFDHAEEISDKLKRLSHVKDVVTAGDKFRLYVEEPSETLPLIFHFAKKNHLKVTSVNTLKPTLEDAFVKLTGLRPEVMAIEKEHIKPARG